MPYAPATVSNEFLRLARREGRPLSPMQVQKLAYFAHGIHLAQGLGPLCDEEPEAWTYGPVFPSLYHALKIWGGGRMLKPAKSPREVIAPPSQAVIERAWREYGHMRAMDLSDRSHDPDGPWFQIRERTDHVRYEVIPNSDIRSYFERLYSADAAIR